MFEEQNISGFRMVYLADISSCMTLERIYIWKKICFYGVLNFYKRNENIFLGTAIYMYVSDYLVV